MIEMLVLINGNVKHADIHLAPVQFTTSATSIQMLSFSTGHMPFLLPHQQCQNTEGSQSTVGETNKTDADLYRLYTTLNACSRFVVVKKTTGRNFNAKDVDKTHASVVLLVVNLWQILCMRTFLDIVS